MICSFPDRGTLEGREIELDFKDIFRPSHFIFPTLCHKCPVILTFPSTWSDKETQQKKWSLSIPRYSMKSLFFWESLSELSDCIWRCPQHLDMLRNDHVVFQHWQNCFRQKSENYNVPQDSRIAVELIFICKLLSYGQLFSPWMKEGRAEHPKNQKIRMDLPVRPLGCTKVVNVHCYSDRPLRYTKRYWTLFICDYFIRERSEQGM